MNYFGSDSLGDRIREIRGELTQEKFAGKVGFSRKQIADWERNRTQPNIEAIEKMASILVVDYQWLATGKTGEQIQSDFAAMRKRIAEESLPTNDREMLEMLHRIGIFTAKDLNEYINWSRLNTTKVLRVAEPQAKYQTIKKRRKQP
jgi:transcriptional regulator with XRE-family HTH domain